MNELIQIEALKPADVFTPGGVDKLILDVEQKVRATEVDTTTDKGRTEAKSLAYKIARSKTALDEMGKTFVAELKRAVGVVDADRKIIRDRFDALKDEVKKPVDDYEAAEEARKEAHTAAVVEIEALADFVDIATVTAADVQKRLTALEVLECLGPRDWQEYKPLADRAYNNVKRILTETRAIAIKRDQERAELERLRKAEAERIAAERKAKAEQEQIERDRQIAERAQRETEERNAAVALAKENERLAAVARAEKAERDAKAAADRAEFEKAAALKKAELDRLAAIEAERLRAQGEREAEAFAAKQREANAAHRANVNSEAMNDLLRIEGMTRKVATNVIAAIASAKISNVTISY